jgi:hypothetical protein
VKRFLNEISGVSALRVGRASRETPVPVKGDGIPMPLVR